MHGQPIIKTVHFGLQVYKTANQNVLPESETILFRISTTTLSYFCNCIFKKHLTTITVSSYHTILYLLLHILLACELQFKIFVFL